MYFYLKSNSKNLRFCLLGIILCISIIFFSTTSYAAKEEVTYPEKVTETQSGIVKIVSSCLDEAGNKYYVHSGNGFIIGTNSTQQYILTDYELISPSEDDYNLIRHGVALATSTKLTNKIDIYFPGDITIQANIVASNEQAGYALLQPASSLNNLSYLKLGTTTTVNRKQVLYLSGYTGEFSLIGKTSIPDYLFEIDDFAVRAIEREPVSVELDGSPSTGKAGAPLVNDNGEVIGMMCYDKKSDSLKVIPAETLSIMLHTLGIKFFDTDPTNDYNLADEEIVAEFESLLAACQQDVMLNEKKYSKKTLTKYKEAINKAVEISTKGNATKDEYQSCIDSLNSTKKKLKPHNFTYRIIQFILLGVILFFVNMNIRQTLKCKKMKQSLQPKQAKERKKKRKHLGALIRIDTREVIWLTKKGVRIGKSPKDVDYCIQNDPTISRLHASIVYNDEKFYLLDNFSTNKTCINHSYIEPGKTYELFDEDTISISNVSFTFRYLQKS